MNPKSFHIIVVRFSDHSKCQLFHVSCLRYLRRFITPILAEFAASLCITFSGLDECDRTQIMRFFRLLGEL